MSISTSRDERDEAKARMVAETTAQLQKDLEYWSVAKVDHAQAYHGLGEQRAKVAELYQEADAWVDLIAEELHSRRHDGLL